MNLGYACINLTLANKKPKIITTRSMVKKTFFNKGLEYVSLLSLLNSQDLIKILKWNHEHKIKLFRLSSDFFPWSSEYKLHHLHSFSDIKLALSRSGIFAKKNNIRLTAHPGPFNVLVSPHSRVFE